MGKFNKIRTVALAIATVFAASTGAHAASVSAVAGWNLLGYSDAQDVVVADAFGNSGKVVTVWKWNAATSVWAFYSPALLDGGKAYAASKNYEFLTTLKSGDGFWVNAKASFSATLPAAPAQVVNADASAGIAATMQTFENLFATSPPAATDATLVGLIDPSFLNVGENKSVFLQELAMNHGPAVGSKFTNITLVQPLDAGAVVNDASHQWFTFSDATGGGPGSAWLAIKNSAGAWLLAGDQRMFDFWANAQAIRQVNVPQNTTSYRNQINANVDRNGLINLGVTQVVLTGDGVVPASGLVIYTQNQGQIFPQACQAGSYLTDCIDGSLATAESKYTVAAYTPAGGTSAPAYSYTNKLKNIPLSGASLASAPYPTITSVDSTWAPGAPVTVNWTLAAGTSSDWITIYTWPNGMNLGMSLQSTPSKTSFTYALPNFSFGVMGKGIWLTVKDANGNQLASEYLY